jgi:hypothetical protein
MRASESSASIAYEFPIRGVIEYVELVASGVGRLETAREHCLGTVHDEAERDRGRYRVGTDTAHLIRRRAKRLMSA